MWLSEAINLILSMLRFRDFSWRQITSSICPILKAHASMVFSCALKNIKGTVQDAVHVTMHQQNLTMAMMDVGML